MQGELRVLRNTRLQVLSGGMVKYEILIKFKPLNRPVFLQASYPRDYSSHGIEGFVGLNNLSLSSVKWSMLGKNLKVRQWSLKSTCICLPQWMQRHGYDRWRCLQGMEVPQEGCCRRNWVIPVIDLNRKYISLNRFKGCLKYDAVSQSKEKSRKPVWTPFFQTKNTRHCLNL